jgi:segregation and condensation protein A
MLKNPDQPTDLDITFKLDEFEGPIGLLLTLITQNKLDITRISLIKIVDQFMEYSKKYKPDLVTLTEFLRVATILLYLKTKAIIGSNEENEEIENETEELLSQLEVIKEFRELRDILKEKMLKRRRFVSKMGGINIKYKESDILKKYDVDDVLRIAVKYFININRNNKIAVKRDEVSVGEKIEELKKILTITPVISFSEIAFSKDVHSVIASFMAILETTRIEMTKLKQEKNFDEIFIIKNL